jgi:hypothetical protein
VSRPKVYLVTVTTVVPVVALNAKEAGRFAGQEADQTLSCVSETTKAVILEDPAALRNIVEHGVAQWNVTDAAYDSGPLMKTKLTYDSTWVQFLAQPNIERFFKAPQEEEEGPMSKSPTDQKLRLEGVNCYGSMAQPQRTIRVTIDNKSVEIDADVLKQMLAEADAEALAHY